MDQELKVDPIYVDLHKRVMKQIEENRERWSQATFATMVYMPDNIAYDMEARERWYQQERVCDTRYCYAGWAVVLAGYPLTNAGAVIMPNGGRAGVEDVARDVLGLNHYQADQIFYFFGKDEDTDQPTMAEMKERVTEVTGIKFD